MCEPTSGGGFLDGVKQAGTVLLIATGVGLVVSVAHAAFDVALGLVAVLGGAALVAGVPLFFVIRYLHRHHTVMIWRAPQTAYVPAIASAPTRGKRVGQSQAPALPPKMRQALPQARQAALKRGNAPLTGVVLPRPRARQALPR